MNYINVNVMKIVEEVKKKKNEAGTVKQNISVSLRNFVKVKQMRYTVLMSDL